MSTSRETRLRRFAALAATACLLAAGAPSGAAIAEYAGVVYRSDPDGETIERYDLAARSWLAPLAVSLGASPSSLVVDGDGIYAAGDGDVQRISLAGGAATPLLTSDRGLTGLAVDGSLLFASHDWGLLVLDKASGAVLAEWTGRQLRGPSVAPSRRRVFVSAPGALLAFDYDETGALGEPIEVTTGSTSEDATWVSPDQATVLTAQGRSSNAATLVFENHLQGRVWDVVFHGGRKIVLRDDWLYVYAEDFALEAALALDSPVSERPGRLFLDRDDVLLFGRGASVRTVALADVPPPEPAPLFDPGGLPEHAVDAVAMDEHGILYLLDRRRRHVFRWSEAQRRYLESIRLFDFPVSMAYDPTRRRLYLGYSFDSQLGALRYVALDESLTERPLRNLEGPATSLAVCGEHVVVSSYNGELSAFDPAGMLTSANADSWVAALAASSATRRIYSSAGYGDLTGFDLSPAGVLGEPQGAASNPPGSPRKAGYARALLGARRAARCASA